MASRLLPREPELFYAYMGMAQMTNQFESERLAYEYMLQEYKANGNTKMVEKLEAAPINKSGGIPKEYYALRDVAMHELGIGTMHEMKSVITGIFFQSFLCRGYTLKEKVNMWRGKASTGVSSMWSEMTATDLTEQVTRVDIPVYFFSGIYDYTVSYSLSKEYFQKLQAPVKGFYTFEHSAHSPIFEEPDKMMEIIREDVLKGTNTLAE